MGETRFAIAEEGWYEAYVVDTKLDITVAGPFRYAEEAVYEARMLERDAMEAEDGDQEEEKNSHQPACHSCQQEE